MFKSAQEMALEATRRAFLACKPKRKKCTCKKKSIMIVNGYIIERVVPSGLYKVKHERIGTTVYVDKNKAIEIANNNNNNN